MIKKIIRFLLLADFVWSVPLAFFTFVGFTIFGEKVFGEGFSGYDPSFIQPLIYTALTVVFFNGVILMGLWFNFRTIYSYYIHESKADFKNLDKKYKLGVFLFLYIFIMSLCFAIWRELV